MGIRMDMRTHEYVHTHPHHHIQLKKLGVPIFTFVPS